MPMLHDNNNYSFVIIYLLLYVLPLNHEKQFLFINSEEFSTFFSIVLNIYILDSE